MKLIIIKFLKLFLITSKIDILFIDKKLIMPIRVIFDIRMNADETANKNKASS